MDNHIIIQTASNGFILRFLKNDSSLVFVKDQKDSLIEAIFEYFNNPSKFEKIYLKGE